MASNYKRYVNALNQASLLAQREFNELWETLDTSNPTMCRNILLAKLPGIIYKHSLMAAEASAQYYEAERIDAGGNEDFEAMIAEPVPIEQIEASVRYAAGHLFPKGEDGIRPEQDRGLFAGQG